MNKSITSLASIAFIGKLLRRCGEFGLLVLIARELGAAALGVYSLALVFLEIGGRMSQLGMNVTVLKFIPEYLQEDDQDHLFGLSVLAVVTPLVIGTFVAGTLYILYPWIITKLDTSNGDVLRIFFLGVPLFALIYILEAVTRGFKETKYSAYIRDIGYAGSAFVIGGSAILLRQSLYSFALGYLFALVLSVFLGIYYLYRLLPTARSITPKFEMKKVYQYSFTVMFAGIAQYVMIWTDVLVIGWFKSDAVVGHYEAAFQTSVLLSFALISVNAIFPSIVSDLYQRREFDVLEQTYQSIVKWVSSLTLLAALFMGIYAQEILSIFGTSFETATEILIVLIFGRVVLSAAGPCGYLLSMAGQERLETTNVILVSILNLCLNVIGVTNYGILGAAVATTISVSVLNLLRVIELYFLLDINPFSKNSLYGFPVVIAGAATMLIIRGTFVNPLLDLVFNGSVSAIVCLIICWKISFTKHDEIIISSI
ncbi:flippase (plasmid) [Haladaptatus sp. SPP-AMP-3]|uniref:flippase n=1 Tax=Haladaptatus sp. SPP-AMP-3 TaxID=3121295 RepID=UPI003C2EDF89